jgi:hypothetical protein
MTFPLESPCIKVTLFITLKWQWDLNPNKFVTYFIYLYDFYVFIIFN